MAHSPEREIGREMVGALHHSSGSFELVAGAMVAALVGFGIDRVLDTTPLFTLVFALVGFLGATYSILLSYQSRMKDAEAVRTLRRRQRGAS